MRGGGIVCWCVFASVWDFVVAGSAQSLSRLSATAPFTQGSLYRGVQTSSGKSTLRSLAHKAQMRQWILGKCNISVTLIRFYCENPRY